MEDYYQTKASVEEYIQLAKDVNGSKLIEKFKTYLPSQPILLELGSGPGTDWKILHADHEVVGSDNSREFLEHLQTTNPEGRFMNLDAVTLDTQEKFDGIYSNKVLHHLQDEELIKSIARQRELLNERGIICHSFWKGEGSEIFKGLFVNYHTEESLRGKFEPYFEILVLEPYREFEDEDSLLLIARIKYFDS